MKFPIFFSVMQECLVKGRRPFDITCIKHIDKSLSVKGRPILNGMIITVEDITALKKLETDMLESVMAGQEAERRRIAREIHDGIGPALSTIKMNLESSCQDENFADDNSITQYKHSIELLDSVTTELRSISHDLLPAVLEDYGLRHGLESLCEKITGSGKMNAVFFSTLSDERLNSKLELGIYRIAQELINNAVKYSMAEKIMVQLIKYESSILFMVEDNGKGFDSGKKPGGIGLVNIRTRVNTLEGTFSLDTLPGKGVTATVEIPLK
ncbi:MAG: sensor histidine kinase [Bacteroidetes bacterium]|nr:sensor histidine kinase [Bacteroidota bacterium]